MQNPKNIPTLSDPNRIFHKTVFPLFNKLIFNIFKIYSNGNSSLVKKFDINFIDIPRRLLLIPEPEAAYKKLIKMTLRDHFCTKLFRNKKQRFKIWALNFLTMEYSFSLNILLSFSQTFSNERIIPRTTIVSSTLSLFSQKF